MNVFWGTVIQPAIYIPIALRTLQRSLEHLTNVNGLPHSVTVPLVCVWPTTHKAP